MRRDNLDLVLTAGIAATAGAVQLLTTLLPQPNPVTSVLQIVTGIPLALLLPGYALNLLLFSGTAPRRVGAVSLLWQAMWSVGLSLVVAVLGGLLLNLTTSGLTRVGWTLVLTAVTLFAVAAAAVDHRRRRPEPTPSEPTRRHVLTSGYFRRPGTIRSACFGLGALVAVTAAVWLAYSGAQSRQPANFAQLWLVPTQSTAGTATIGVRNSHGGTERFAVSLRNGTQAAGSWQLTLGAGQVWQHDVPVTAGVPLEATLSQPNQGGAPQVVVLRQPIPLPTTSSVGRPPIPPTTTRPAPTS